MGDLLSPDRLVRLAAALLSLLWAWLWTSPSPYVDFITRVVLEGP